MPTVTLIDNYDSFTWNLVHYLGSLGAAVSVYRNDRITVAEVIGERPDAIVLSPGPCTPKEAGICLDLIKAAGARIPIFGVCLGHQAIGEAYGGKVVRAAVPMHGKLSAIRHGGKAIFAGIASPFQATRYHSLIVERASPAGRTHRDGHDRGRAHHGPVAQEPARTWRAIPSREHSVRTRPSILRNFLDLAAGLERGPSATRLERTKWTRSNP